MFHTPVCRITGSPPHPPGLDGPHPADPAAVPGCAPCGPLWCGPHPGPRLPVLQVAWASYSCRALCAQLRRLPAQQGGVSCPLRPPIPPPYPSPPLVHVDAIVMSTQLNSLHLSNTQLKLRTQLLLRLRSTQTQTQTHSHTH